MTKFHCFRISRSMAANVSGALLLLSSSAVQAQLTLELEVSKNECERICRAGARGHSDDTCRMAYYFISGPNAGTCRTTLDDVPNLQMRGKYRIWSGFFQAWLTNDLIAYKWPNISGPVGTSSSGGTTGIQVNTSKVALNGAAACSQTSWDVAKRWTLRGPGSSTFYYEAGGYLCKSNGTAFFTTGPRYESYGCSSNFQNCRRYPSYDAKLGQHTAWKPGKSEFEFIWEDGGRVDRLLEN